MQRALLFVTFAERFVVIAAALLAFFPLLQWYQERDDRQRLHLASITQMMADCASYFEGEINSLGGEDIYEALCNRVLQEVSIWEAEP